MLIQLPDRQAVLKAVMLRRTKDATIGRSTHIRRDWRSSLFPHSLSLKDGKPILNLPARQVEVVQCFFDPAERDFYDAFEKKQELSFNKVGWFRPWPPRKRLTSYPEVSESWNSAV